MRLNKIQRIVFVSVLFLMTVMVFSSDAYVPSLPAMTLALNTTHKAVKLTIAIYLLGLGTGPILFGPLSDHFGRRVVSLVGLGVAIIGVTICILGQNITTVIIGRFIQGAGVASSMTVNRAMLLDVFHDRKLLSQISSLIGIIMALFPAIAPIVGGYIQNIFGWRANFGLMLLLLIIALIWVFIGLPETHHDRPKRRLRVLPLATIYMKILTNEKFIIYPICAGLGFASLMAYLAMSPFIFQVIIGLTPIQYGWLGVVLGFGIITGALLNMRLIRDLEPENIIVIAGILCLMSSGTMLFIALLGIINVSVIMIPFYFFTTGLTFLFSNTFAGGLIQVTENKGQASAVYSTVQLSGAAIANIFAAMLHVKSQIPLAAVLFALSGLTLFLFSFSHRRLSS